MLAWLHGSHTKSGGWTPCVLLRATTPHLPEALLVRLSAVDKADATFGPQRLWRHQGLNLKAPFAIGSPALAGAVPDVTVSIDRDGLVPAGAVGPAVAEMRTAERSYYALYETTSGYLLRFHGQCDFLVDEQATKVVCQLHAGAHDALVPIFMAGTVSALLLTLRGYAVLHGSAVSQGGLTVLFAGESGRGKTTMAALCCAAGAKFITDDVVPLVQRGGHAMCFGLSSELRLRGSAYSIADLFPLEVPRRMTADNRLALQPSLAESELNGVSAVVLPRPARETSLLGISKVPPSKAAVQLLANARIPGMVPVDLQRPYFEAVAGLANEVPVLEVTVPWGPPFGTDWAPGFWEQLGIASARFG